MNHVLETRTPTPDFAAIKQRQQATWASGDFAVVGTTLQIVGESLAEAVDLRAGERVLDVAAGNGNATLAAARRFADVTSTDYVPALLDKGRAARAAEGLPVQFQVADAEALPFADAQLRRRAVDLRRDVRARPRRSAASEMLRVLRPRRPHRPGELDAGGLHRPPVQGDRRARAAAGRAAVARAVGHRGAPGRAVRRAGRAHRAASAATSTSATARRRTGCRCSATSTARRTRPSPRSTPAASRRSSATSPRCSRSSTSAGAASLVVPSEYLESRRSPEVESRPPGRSAPRRRKGTIMTFATRIPAARKLVCAALLAAMAVNAHAGVFAEGSPSQASSTPRRWSAAARLSGNRRAPNRRFRPRWSLRANDASTASRRRACRCTHAAQSPAAPAKPNGCSSHRKPNCAARGARTPAGTTPAHIGRPRTAAASSARSGRAPTRRAHARFRGCCWKRAPWVAPAGTQS